MKKLILFSLMIAAVLGFTACTDDKEESTTVGVEYNLDAYARGEGYMKASFPTGYLMLEGTANFEAHSSNDSLANVCAPAGTPNFRAVLADTAAYDNMTVYASRQVASDIRMDSISGTFEAGLKGYAKYGNIYLIIDEHWPAEKVDSITVAELDSL